MKTKALLAALIGVLVAGCETVEQRDGSTIPGTANPAAAPAPKPAAAPAAAPVAAKPVPPVATPAPAPAPKKPAVVNLASTELFEFNKATLTPQAKQLLDTEVIAKLKDLGSIRYINVNGHADRLGSAQYNQKLSERRADAVKAYLVSKGASQDSIETFGFGKTLPSKACPDQKDRKSVIECLAPNRRVVVEIQGTPR